MAMMQRFMTIEAVVARRGRAVAGIATSAQTGCRTPRTPSGEPRDAKDASEK
jgi:hypothetical protein